MTRILHTGDTHLGYQQYHLPERREDFLAAFRQVARDAIEEDVDAVVHAGDLFHDRQPTLSDIMGALDVLRTLSDADVPFLGIVGNHESKRDRQWLDLFETMGLARRLGDEPVTIDDVALYGLDFVPRSRRESLEFEFDPHDAEYAALVSHGLFEPFEHGDWDARRILSESPVEFDAMLLGDDHTPQTKHLTEPHETWLTYCGSTERASASEREERGYNLVSFDEALDIRRRGLQTREFVFVDVELNEGEGSGLVRERLSEYDLADAVVIVTLTGDGESVMQADIEAYAEERGALVARVNDRRESTEESELDVSFADPDQAVRERISDLGLSPAARDIDETIRASKVADSNVAEAVQDHVAELVAEEEFESFQSAPDDGDDANETADEEAKSQQTVEEPDESESQQTVESPTQDETNSDSQVTMGDYT